MGGTASHIPTEVYLDFLGFTIPVHWNYHAMLMVLIWFVLVPVCVLAQRYGKPKPTFHGIRVEIALKNPEWWWFSTHKFGLYITIGLAVVAAAIALTVSKGFSGTVHSYFGIATIVLGVLQVVSSWVRGKHGGKYYYTAKPRKPETWAGDHYNMTPRRKRFEAYHKTGGYAAVFCAVGAVASGLMQYSMPWLGVVVMALIAIMFAAVVVLEYKGYRYDGYRAAFGFDPEHPYNKARKEL